MEQVKTLAFRIEEKIANLIAQDAEKQHTSGGAILRQILFKHYEKDDRLQPAKAEQ